jgi:hypothetical protein
MYIKNKDQSKNYSFHYLQQQTKYNRHQLDILIMNINSLYLIKKTNQNQK